RAVVGDRLAGIGSRAHVIDRHRRAENVILAGVVVGPGPAAEGVDAGPVGIVMEAFAVQQGVAGAVADAGHFHRAVEVHHAVIGHAADVPRARAAVATVAVQTHVIGDAAGRVRAHGVRDVVAGAQVDGHDLGTKRGRPVAVAVLVHGQ